MAVVNETTKNHGELVAKVHPGLWHRSVGGEREWVGVVNDQAHVKTWLTCCLVALVLVTEAFCRRKSKVVSSCTCKLCCLKRASSSQELLCKVNASRALAKA